MDELKYKDGKFTVNGIDVNSISATSAITETQEYNIITNEEFKSATIDSEGKIIEGTRINGVKYIANIESKTLSELENKIPSTSTFVSKSEFNQLADKIKPLKIWLPNNVYCLDNSLIQIFKSSMILAHNPENYELRINRYNMPSAQVNWGANYDSMYEYLPNLENSDFKLRFGFYNDITGLAWADTDTTFVHVAKKILQQKIKMFFVSVTHFQMLVLGKAN